MRLNTFYKACASRRWGDVEDYGKNEKIVYLPRKLTEEGSGPFGNERPGDLCYFNP